MNTASTRALIAVTVAAALLGACTSRGTTEVPWQLMAVSADGRVLTLDATRGACGGKAFANTSETATTVTVRVLQHTTGSTCSKVGIRQAMTVRLRGPLGTRVLRGCSPVAGAAVRTCRSV